jgi:hypothetical protein
MSVALQVVAPIGVRTTKKLNDPVTDPPKYRFNGTGLNTSIPDTPSAAAWSADSNQTLTCDVVAADLPAGKGGQLSATCEDSETMQGMVTGQQCNVRLK